MGWDPRPGRQAVRLPELTSQEGEAMVAVHRLQPRNDNPQDVPVERPSGHGRRGQVAEQHRAIHPEPLDQPGQVLGPVGTGVVIVGRARGAVQDRLREPLGVQAVVGGVFGEAGRGR